jgi:hypothetical protein
MVPVHSEHLTSKVGISAKLTLRALLGVISHSSFASLYLIASEIIGLPAVIGKKRSG